jgi:hypothetical protein
MHDGTFEPKVVVYYFPYDNKAIEQASDIIVEQRHGRLVPTIKAIIRDDGANPTDIFTAATAKDIEGHLYRLERARGWD